MENEAQIIEQTEDRMVIKDSEGTVKDCIKLFTFDSEETKLSYICFTDKEVDENSNIIVYAGTYDPTGEDPTIKPLKTEKEWKVIQETLQEIVSNVQGDKNEG